MARTALRRQSGLHSCSTSPVLSSGLSDDSGLSEDEFENDHTRPAITFISPFASAASAKPVSVKNLPSNQPPMRGPLAPSAKNKSPQLLTVAAWSWRRGSAMPHNAQLDKLALEQDYGLNRRRRSVDVAALAAQSGRHDSRKPAKRLRSDNEAESEQNTNEGPSRGREAMFADHLTSILHHSLSLCAGKGETSLDLFARGEEVMPMLAPANLDALYSPVLPASASPRGSLNPSTPSISHFQQFRIKRRASQAEFSALRKGRLIANLSSWGFAALELDTEELLESASILFEAAMQMEGVDIGIGMDTFNSLLLSLRSAYHARNGYHNFAHATDVLQATYFFLVALNLAPPLSHLQSCSNTKWKRPAHVDAAGSIGSLLRPMDVFSLMVAAIGHDVGHPGLSNAYMVNAKTPVAQVYGDKSVLENFHLVTLINMLRKHGLGHLFGAADQGPSMNDNDCRKVLFASVLATDMSRHFPFVAKLQEMARRNTDDGRSAAESEEDRLLLCSGLMKCADISNPTRPHEVAKRWSTALLEEWSVQAKIEAEFKLPISVVTLNPAEAKAQAKSQVGFINLFTQPLFDALAAFVPDFSRFAHSCREGRRVWEAIVLANEDALPPSISGIVTPQTTPRPSPSSFLSSSALAAKDAADGVVRRRRPPPQPLSFARSNLIARGSLDSTASSTNLSPTSPLFSPDARRNYSSFSSAYSVATTVSSASIPIFRTQCTGTCGEVTEKCPSCLQREQDNGSTLCPPSGSDDTITTVVLDRSAQSTPGEELELCELWPPVAFWPSFVEA